MEKKLRIKFFLLFLTLVNINLFAQTDEDEYFGYSAKSKFGLRLGLGVSSFRSENFLNPRTYLGYAAGVYHHGRIKNRSYFYYEIAARFKGSNFNTNPDSITYSKISLFYTELPVAYMYRLGKVETRPTFLMFGGGASLLIKSSMLLGPNPLPEYFNLPLKKGDLFVMTGIHQYYGGVGLQINAKWGLTNINKNNWAGYEKVKPNLERGLPIKNWSLEFALIF